MLGSRKCSWIITSRSGSRKGSGLSRTERTTVNSDVVAPMHNAITRTATIENPGDRKRVRTLILRSRRRLSSPFQLQTARVCSLIRVRLPKERRAAWRASSGGTPCSRCSSSSSSRSDCSSRSTSASRFLICHHVISALLSRGPHYACDSFRHLLPLRFFDHKSFSALFRKSVILEFPIAIRGGLPLGNNPSFSLHTVQRRIERAMLHLKEVIGGPLNMLANLMTMRWTIKKCSQDEHVQGSLEYIRALPRTLGHGRHPTSNRG